MIHKNPPSTDAADTNYTKCSALKTTVSAWFGRWMDQEA